MSKWTIEALPAAKREVKSLPRDLQARFFHIGDMLTEHGPQQVGMPHVRHLDGELWEMRMKGKSGIARAIYFTKAEQTYNRLLCFREEVAEDSKTGVGQS